MSGKGDYVEHKFPKRACGRWLSVHLLALHERFALAHFGELLRNLATKRSGLLERFTFTSLAICARGLSNTRHFTA